MSFTAFQRFLAHVGPVREELASHRVDMVFDGTTDVDGRDVYVTYFSDLEPVRWRREKSRYRQALARLGRSCRAELEDALRRGPERDRELFALIEASGSIFVARCALEVLSGDPDPWRRANGLQLAYTARASAFLDDFIRALDDPDPSIQEQVISYLDPFVKSRRGRRVRSALIALATDQNLAPRVRVGALNALWRARDNKEVSMVARGLLAGDTDIEVRRAAAALLPGEQ